MQTFCHRERKKVLSRLIHPFFFTLASQSLQCTIDTSIIVQMPDMLNWFGWCTWDAFYTTVTAEGVKQGLEM